MVDYVLLLLYILAAVSVYLQSVWMQSSLEMLKIN